ncbi:MAG: DUF2247 family protein [Pseudomonadota bacterium]|nr:DUF2247 family protein [Gammaproteobacteria bacterium]MBU2546398.1 DUF2247 family protein [Gammaproteobacteria bacterium]
MEYLLPHEGHLKNFQTEQLAINWCTLLLGWIGPGHFESQLSISDLQEFAKAWLMMTDENNDLVTDLILSDGQDFLSVKEILEALCKKNKSDFVLEVRKWRYILLKECFEKIVRSNDYLYGLLELTDFWLMFDFPDDSPHVVQGRENTLSPTDYYTEDNFKKLINRHKQWLQKELEAIYKLQIVE